MSAPGGKAAAKITAEEQALFLSALTPTQQKYLVAVRRLYALDYNARVAAYSQFEREFAGGRPDMPEVEREFLLALGNCLRLVN